MGRVVPHYYLNLKDEQPFSCEECGGIIVEFLEVEYLAEDEWLATWRLGCALYGPFIGPTTDAIEWVVEKPLRHYKTVDAGPYDLRKIEIESIVNVMKDYLGSEE